MNKMRLLLALPIIGVLMLGGCAATLEDFQAMTASERADYLCNRHRQVESLDDDINKLEKQIAELEGVLTRGYRLHRSCKSVPLEIVGIDAEKKTVCYRDERKIFCKQVDDVTGFELEEREVCEDVPVEIDGDLERDKMREAVRLVNEYRREADALFDQCYRKARQMGAEDAFRFYQSVR